MKNIKLFITREFKQHFILFSFVLFCIALLLIRAKITHSIFFFFLIWNLFLAYTPLALASVMMSKISLIEKPYCFYPLLLCWLLLLPNAPYLITDFTHLGKEDGVPIWFDILLLISFAAAGMFFGLASMKKMYAILASKFNASIAHSIMLITCLLSGFGIYLGRFLRYNSWDILYRPFSLMAGIFGSLFSVQSCRPAWGIMLGFGTLMYLLFSLYNDAEN